MKDENIIFINIPQDRPLKLVIENNLVSSRTEKYFLTTKEVLKNILNSDWELRRTLTTQQIRSEKGKVRRGYYDEVINFLHKRGVNREYIENEVAMEREKIIFSQILNVSSDLLKDSKFGVFDVEQYYRLINGVEPTK